MKKLTEVTHGDVLVLSLNGVVKKERMVIGRFGKYHALDSYTGNVVDINDLHLDVVKGHDSAKSIVEAYQKKGYVVTIK